MSSGSSTPSATSVTTSSSSPWSGVQPYLTQGFEEALNLYRSETPSYYPNSTVVPMSDQTITSLDLQEKRATDGSPLIDSANTMIDNTISGEYLKDGNPYLQKAITNATQPVMDRFNEDIMPKIQSGFSDAGRYGSGLQARSQERAGQMALDQVGKIANDMAYGNYADERTNQLSATQLAPGLADQEYKDINQLAGVGEAYEAQAGNELQEEINRFRYDQNAPGDALTQFMTLIGGGSYGGDTVTSEPLYNNKVGDALGMASTATGIAGTLFGKNGIFP